MRRLLVLLAFALALSGCVPPAPLPVPVPVPPTPTPTPVPVPTPERTITVGQYEAVTTGTTEADLQATLGEPWRSTVMGAGVTAWVYAVAPDEQGVVKYAEFWVQDGKVVNKNLL